jgi:hypothetical protein
MIGEEYIGHKDRCRRVKSLRPSLRIFIHLYGLRHHINQCKGMPLGSMVITFLILVD